MRKTINVEVSGFLLKIPKLSFRSNISILGVSEGPLGFLI